MKKIIFIISVSLFFNAQTMIQKNSKTMVHKRVPLECAVRANNTKLAETELELRDNPNKISATGDPLLHYASSTKMAELFFAYGANVNVTDKHGSTFFHLIMGQPNSNLDRWVATHCDGHQTNKKGNTPAHTLALAARLFSPTKLYKKFELLWQAEVNFYQRNLEGKIARELALERAQKSTQPQNKTRYLYAAHLLRPL
ncbi:MAG: ankyrin repeat domain-containing protein [Candidatus Babeliaceae bacterium]